MSDSTILLLEQKVEKYENTSDWDSVLIYLNMLGGEYYYNNDLSLADKALSKAKRIANKHNKTSDKLYSDIVFNHTTILDIKGFDEEAIEGYLEIIELDKKRGENDHIIALGYQNIGSAYMEAGDFVEAKQALKRALQIRQSTKKKNLDEVGGIHYELAVCHRNENNLDLAIEQFLKSLEVLSTFNKNNEYVNRVRYNCYNHLSDIYISKGEFSKARGFIDKALFLKENFEVYNAYRCYQNLGNLNVAEGRPNKALKYFDKAIELAKKEADGFANFPQIANAYLDKGNALLFIENFDRAIIEFQKGLQIIAINFNEKNLSKVPPIDQIIQKRLALDLIGKKANTFLKKYELDNSEIESLKQSVLHFDHAIKLISLIRRGYITEDAKHKLAEKTLSIYDGAIEANYLLYKYTGLDEYKEKAFLIAEKNKAVSLLEFINNEMALVISGIPDSIIEEERALNIQLNFLENQLAEAKNRNTSQKDILRFEKERFSLKEQHKRLISLIEKKYPQYYQLKYDYEVVSINKVKNELLDEKTALLEFFVSDQFVYRFLITKEDFIFKRMEYYPGFVKDINELRKILQTVPQSETFKADFLAFSNYASNLHKFLIDDQLTTFGKHCDKLIVVPDELLNLIPFELLLNTKPDLNTIDYSLISPSYLMESFYISYSYSSTLFFTKGKETFNKKDKGVIAFAPSFNATKKTVTRACDDNSPLYNLRCASKEVNQIKEICAAKVTEGLTCTKDAFLNQAEEANIIHLATHACVNEENPRLHRIHFSDDYITPFDLYKLKLNAELVVLSACNTGTGKIVKGEGVMSLSRSFIQAGAASTLMSLWSVDDCATSDIMISYYDFLKAGLSKSHALQKAKQTYIRNATDKLKAHPYYWAAFVQSGDIDPVKVISPTRTYFFMVLGLVVLAFCSLLYFRNKNSQ